MIRQIRNILESIRTSLWFWPVLMTLFAIALAQGLILLDQSGWLGRSTRLDRISNVLGAEWLFGAGADGARSLLATIAASMVAIAATVFSVTIVALSLAAGQMGPRLLRTFIRDRGTQISLGMFIATFAYCIIVLGVVNEGVAAKPFVPKAAVSMALALALVSLAVLIYFIHNVAQAIQAPVVIGVVGCELEESIERLFPASIGTDQSGAADATAAHLPASFSQDSAPVHARCSGYLQLIDGEELAKLARAADVILWVDRRPGDHVIAGTEIARIWPSAKSTAALGEQVQKAYVFGATRTPAQDVRFLINQLVEIAQRALSPGINDPITAEACIDHLGVALGKLTQRRMPSAFRLDDSGTLRIVVARPDTFRALLGAAFDPIRTCSRASLQVSLRLGALIAELAQLARTAEQRDALLGQVQMIARAAGDLPEEQDRLAVQVQCRRAVDALSRIAGAAPVERTAAAAATLAT